MLDVVVAFVLCLVAVAVGAGATYVLGLRAAEAQHQLAAALRVELDAARQYARGLEQQLADTRALQLGVPSPVAAKPEAPAPNAALPREVQAYLAGLDNPQARAEAEEYALYLQGRNPLLEGSAIVEALVG